MWVPELINLERNMERECDTDETVTFKDDSQPNEFYSTLKTDPAEELECTVRIIEV